LNLAGVSWKGVARKGMARKAGMARKKKPPSKTTTILGFASWEEAEEWARKLREEELRAELQHAEWCWPLEEGEYPLDGLLTGACLRVLRALWAEAPLSWPVQIARQTGLSRASVHASLARLTDRQLVEAVPAWNSYRQFGYQLIRENPLVRELDKLFKVEAKFAFAARVEADRKARAAEAGEDSATIEAGTIEAGTIEAGSEPRARGVTAAAEPPPAGPGPS
jgi:hypothetical protein